MRSPAAIADVVASEFWSWLSIAYAAFNRRRLLANEGDLRSACIWNSFLASPIRRPTMRHALLASLVLILLAGFDRAPAADVASGWRGNGTGLWPDTTAPLNWSRIAKGAM